MRLGLSLVLAASAALAFPAAASAEIFKLSYTTLADATSGPAVTTTATITADADPFTAGQWDITSISGTRGGEAITGFDSFYNVFYYPAAQPFGYSFQTYLDDVFAEITYTAGGIDYNLYRGSGDTSFYHEFSSDGFGRLINAADFAITLDSVAAVPEPASWMLMLAGLGIAAASLRTRRAAVRFA